MSNLPPYLDAFCPMHVAINETGHIVHCGPTLSKLRGYSLIGRRFLEVFAVKRPRGVTRVADLAKMAGVKLHLQFRDQPATELKGMMSAGSDGGASVINLSFGISVIDAVRDYSLTSADFAATELTIEMLYLVEAKSAAMDASRKLNLRLQGAKIAAEEQAFTDTLTGLKNRRAIDTILARNVEWGMPFALMQVDLDWFKAVNDTLGHAAGDHVLQNVARIMVEQTRDNDTVARVGGDEFVVMLPNTHDPSVLTTVGERIIKNLSEPMPFQGEMCRISASIGTALYEPGAGMTIESVVDNADVALYASKRAGRARQTFYSEKLRENPENLEVPKGRAAPGV